MNRREFLKGGAAWWGAVSFASAYPAQAAGAAPGPFVALPLAGAAEGKPGGKRLEKYGVPFVEGALPFPDGGSAKVAVGGRVRRIFLLGMTPSAKPHAWPDPRNTSIRFFVGDDLGAIRLTYADDSEQVFPLILGEDIWWGDLFAQYPEPFASDAPFRDALSESLRLYPPAPVADGAYVAVIDPGPAPIRSITVEGTAKKAGHPVVLGITVEPATGEAIEGTELASSSALAPEFADFAERRPLRPAGSVGGAARLDGLRRALYSSEENYRGRVPAKTPAGYSGPAVSFSGDISAEILANAFSYNVQDILDKIDAEGAYHTSTKGALSWGGYNGFGTYRENVGRYYGDAFARDLGRSLQELTALGYLAAASRCADFCIRAAREWETDPALKIGGQVIPRHWGQVINRPRKGSCFENDGHGLISLYLYLLWQRLPDRDAWLRERWPDVKAAGDWILWQFDHPEISGATEVLHSTGESAHPPGFSVYPDAACMNALEALAQMADSLPDPESARRWRDRASRMRRAIGGAYAITDPNYGRVWTLACSGWSHQSTVLGPLIFLADSKGFAPQDDDPAWRPLNAAAYQRLTDTYVPFGFYGQAMGYGQGFVTQAALLLDRMRDATTMLGWAAREIHDPRWGSFVTPEGCEIDPTGRYWYRIGDLGNGVQEGEIVKALRLVIGVDDTRPDRPRIFPRMPFGWTALSVDRYPMLIERSGRPETRLLRCRLERSGTAMRLEIGADRDVGPVAMRLGPFSEKPLPGAVAVNGEAAAFAAESSGDSWWAALRAPIPRTP